MSFYQSIVAFATKTFKWQDINQLKLAYNDDSIEEEDYEIKSTRSQPIKTS
ncbi:hypothetical protein MCEHALHM7_00030 [Methylophilaceae bacterium]